MIAEETQIMREYYNRTRRFFSQDYIYHKKLFKPSLVLITKIFKLN